MYFVTSFIASRLVNHTHIGFKSGFNVSIARTYLSGVVDSVEDFHEHRLLPLDAVICIQLHIAIHFKTVLVSSSSSELADVLLIVSASTLDFKGFVRVSSRQLSSIY